MAQVLMILGRRGAGKSYILRRELEQLPRVVLYDTLREKEYNVFRRVDSFPALCEVLLEDPPIFRVAYAWNGETTREEDFERVCQAVYASHSLCFAVDEVDQYCAPNFLPRHLDMIVSLGRHRDISFYCASRRPKEIHPLIRSQAQEVYSLVQTEPADLEWVEAVIGPEAAARVPGLGRFQYVHWHDGTTDTPTGSVPEPENKA